MITAAALVAGCLAIATGDVENQGNTLPIRSRIPPPAGYERIPAAPSSFGAWLRELPARPGRSVAHLYNGQPKSNQTAHHAVLDIDIGDKDLQQCADAVIRLRAEYLLAISCAEEIAFKFTSGDVAGWAEWREGQRPVVSGNRVSWRDTGRVDVTYENFLEYLETVFMYAGSSSLEGELLPVADPSEPEIGDVYIKGGYPGHAALIVDVAEDTQDERVLLLAQSYMPAQDIHILKSFEDDSPWYAARSEGVLKTPLWVFDYEDLRRFPRTTCESESN